MMLRVLRFASLLTLVVGSAVPAQAAKLVVLESTIAALPAGTELDDAKLNVAADQHVTVMHQDGRVFEVVGPHTGPPDETTGFSERSAVMAALGRMVGGGTTSDKSLGVVRAEGGATVGPERLTIDRPGQQCAVASRPPSLARAAAGRAESARLKMVGGGESEVTWPAEATAAPWPAAVPLSDGSTYLLRRAGNPLPVAIRLNVLTTADPSDAFVIAWMSGKGCDSQAQAALAALPQD